MWKKVFSGMIGFSLVLGIPMVSAEPTQEERAGYREAPVFLEDRGDDAQGGIAAGEGMSVPEPVEDAAGAAPASEPVPVAAAEPTMPVVSEPVPPVPELSEEEKQQAILDSRRILINLASHSLALYEGNTRVRLYPIAIGKPSTPTPVGYYKIRSKDVNPTWTDPQTGYSIPSGESNPLGYRWMEIQGNYGIHGTNRPDSIGRYVSNGCIRMQEKDVEALFDMVQLGTPVEITYNRVVVEKNPDDVVTYYIYPDSYGRQELDAAAVNEWLDGYGVRSFESDEAIEQKIYASDGEPTYIGKVYPIRLNGKAISAKAILQGNVIYLPAMEIARAAQVDLGWDGNRSMLFSKYGEAEGYDKKSYLYVDAANAPKLFHLTGVLQADDCFVMEAVTGTQVRPAAPKTEPKPASPQQMTQPRMPEMVQQQPAQPQSPGMMQQPAQPQAPGMAQTQPAQPRLPEPIRQQPAQPAQQTSQPPASSPERPQAAQPEQPQQPQQQEEPSRQPLPQQEQSAEQRPWQREEPSTPARQDGRTAGNEGTVTEQRDASAPVTRHRPVLRHVDLEGEEE